MQNLRFQSRTHRERVPLKQADGGEVQEELGGWADMNPLHCEKSCISAVRRDLQPLHDMP